jgi:hypothetical protein
LVCATAFHKLYEINTNDGFERRRKEDIGTNIINYRAVSLEILGKKLAKKALRF